MRTVTDKQARFAEEYLIDLNATQAAIRAGYSEKTARSVGSENLSKPDIQEAIQKAMKERSDRLQIDSDFVLAEAIKMYRMAKGEIDSQVMIREINTEGASSQYTAPMKLTNINGMGKALEIIGKHVDVEAFNNGAQVSVEVEVIDPFKNSEAV